MLLDSYEGLQCGLNSKGQVFVRLGTSAEKQQNGLLLANTLYPAHIHTIATFCYCCFFFLFGIPGSFEAQDEQTGELCCGP